MIESLLRSILPTVVKHRPGRKTVVLVALIATAVTGALFGSTLIREFQSGSWAVKEGLLQKIDSVSDAGWKARGLVRQAQQDHYNSRGVLYRITYSYEVGERSLTNTMDFRYEELPFKLSPPDPGKPRTVRLFYDVLHPEHSTLVTGFRFRTVWRAGWTWAASFAVLCLIVQFGGYFMNASKEADELDELRKQQAWRN